VTKIILTGWNQGFNKVQFNFFVRGKCGFGLAEAKGVVDRILEGVEVELTVDEFSMEDHRHLSELGVKYRIAK
jgi:ribosomal protein L7/L12